MSVAPILMPSRTEWRSPGCGPRCTIIHVTFPGRRYAEEVVVHDAGHHEAYGANVLLAEGSVLFAHVVATDILEVDGRLGEARVNGEALYLTPVELRFLTYLAQNIGRLCTYHEVLRHVWGAECAEARMSRYGRGQYVGTAGMRVHVHRLRAKLGAAGRLVTTVPGIGYRLLQEEPAS